MNFSWSFNNCCSFESCDTHTNPDMFFLIVILFDCVFVSATGSFSQVHHSCSDGVHPLSEPVPDHSSGSDISFFNIWLIFSISAVSFNIFLEYFIDVCVCVSLSQHYLYELVIKTLVQHNLFYMLHQYLQYHVLSDSKPLVSSTFLIFISQKLTGTIV